MIWRIILWFLLILVALITIVIILPVGVRVRYQEDTLKMWYTIGPIRLLRYPDDDTRLELFWFLRPKLRIQRLELKLHLAGDDPAAVALQYGGAWAAIGGLLPLLEEAFILKKRQLDVDCNFNGGATTLDAKLDITIGLGRLVWCLVRYSMDVLDRTETKHSERR